MRLKSIELANYRKYAELGPIEFPDGLLGVFGSNGSGKSTLVEAVAWALYGNAAARTDRAEIKRQGAGPLDPCRVILELEHGGSEYRVVREMKGRSLSADASVTAGQKPLAKTSRETEKYISRLLGMDRESFFTSFFARQKELDALSDLRPAERRKLIIRMLGIDAIDRAIEMMRADTRGLQGRIEALRDSVRPEMVTERREELASLEKEIAELTARLDERRAALMQARAAAGAAQQALEMVMDKRRQYEELATRYTETSAQLTAAREGEQRLREEIAALTQEKSRLPELKLAAKEFDRAGAEREEMERLRADALVAAELDAQRERIQARLEEIAVRLSELEGKRKRREQLEREQESARGRLAETRQAMDEALASETRATAAVQHAEERLDEHLAQSERWAELGPESTCPTCLRPLGEDFESIVGHFQAEETGLRQRLEQATTARLAAEETREELKRGLEQVQDELADLQSALAEVQDAAREAESLRAEEDGLRETHQSLNKRLSETGKTAYDRVAHDRLLARIGELAASRDEFVALSGKLERLPALEKQLAETTSRVADLTKTLAGVEAEGKTLAFSHDEFENRRTGNDAAQAAAHQADIATKEAEHHVGLAEGAAGAMRQNLAELARQQERLDKDTAEHERLLRLEEIFTRFRTHLIGRIRPALAAKAGDLLRDLTDGRYSQLELDDDYQIYIYDDGEKFGIDRFSGGEKDLANLSLRLAISEQIAETAGDELGFIVLDEIFGSQDPERRDAVMRALARLSNRFRQVIVITHVEEVKDRMQYAVMVTEDEAGISRAHLE